MEERECNKSMYTLEVQDCFHNFQDHHLSWFSVWNGCYKSLKNELFFMENRKEDIYFLQAEISIKIVNMRDVSCLCKQDISFDRNA